MEINASSGPSLVPGAPGPSGWGFRHRIGFGLNLLLTAVLSIGVAAGVNFFFATQPKMKKLEFDWTGEGTYTLSDKTHKVLGQLKEAVAVYVLQAPMSQIDALALQRLATTLDNYAAASEKIRVETMNIEQDGLKIRGLIKSAEIEISALGGGNKVILLAPGKKKKIIDLSEMYEADWGGGMMGGPSGIKAWKAEQTLTSSIFALTEGDKAVVYFLTGHGERKIDAQEHNQYAKSVRVLRDAENMEVKPLSLLSEKAGSVPKDCDVLVIAGPTKPLLEQETKAVDAYLSAGGSLLLLLDGFTPNGLGPFLEKWGVEATGQDLVISEQCLNFDPTFLAVSEITPHRVTEGMDGQYLALHQTCSVKSRPGASPDLQVVDLLKIGAAWVMTDPNKDPRKGSPPQPATVGVLVTKSLEKKSGALNSPFAPALGGGADGAPEQEAASPTAEPPPVAPNEPVDVSAPSASPALAPKGAEGSPSGPSATASPKESRILVIGDADFVGNRYQEIAANQAFYINAVRWLASQESLISIPPKDNPSKPIGETPEKMQRAFWVSYVFLPGLAIAFGVTVWLFRRK